MATITTIELDDGSLLRVETATPTGTPRTPSDAYEPIGRPRPAETVASAADTLRDAVDRVCPAVQDVVDSLRAMPRRPDRITLEFGVKVTAEAGVVLARTAAEAHFTVGVEWETTGGRGGSGEV
ncbi:CU044_2847 family protein [Streptomyces sp. NBC_00124]|uniref:CU044_2847 family protein n=1 Tax=Streptomyces sp. NBC_00124 TaxID=2975662 RepID=UPI00225804C9|nr:CU044_2847 family protein [Streptomyces sp. NBC_00124]MCX5360088.1 CU044_2847 family protein [Streptomyces sp. NBC_00124]